MKIEELRIGNWVYASPSLDMEIIMPTKKAKVGGIGMFGDITLSSNPLLPDWTIPIKHLEPIPLSPSILEAAGFVKMSEWTLRLNEATVLVGFENPLSTAAAYRVYVWYNANSMAMCLTDKPATTLHQLQNLYYALTQTELTINL